MDGVHDMGGMHGFGRVVETGGELAYHERWEPRVFAIQMLVGVERLGAGPGGRSAREEMDPAAYLAASYYERWLYSAEQRLLRKGTIAPGDVEAMMERLENREAMPEHQDAAMAERMLENLEASYGLVFSQPVLLALVEAGLTRDDAYRTVQRDAMTTWESRRPFLDVLRDDSAVRRSQQGCGIHIHVDPGGRLASSGIPHQINADGRCDGCASYPHMQAGIHLGLSPRDSCHRLAHCASQKTGGPAADHVVRPRKAGGRAIARCLSAARHHERDRLISRRATNGRHWLLR